MEVIMRVTVNVNDAIGKAAVETAKQEGISVSSLYSVAIERYLKELRRQEAIKYIDSLIGTMYVADNALEVLKEERRRSERTIK
jgi:hypothetical protein